MKITSDYGNIMKEKFVLRVMSGKYRGRGISSPEGKDKVRPTSGMVKQALFNMLRFSLADKVFLDLFAGTGQMGIEAVSAGAKKCILADIDPSLAKKNAAAILAEKEYEIIPGDCVFVLESMIKKGIKPHIIFADPPYEAGLYEKIISLAGKVLDKDGTLVLEHPAEMILDGNENFTVESVRKYGKKSLTFMKGQE